MTSLEQFIEDNNVYFVANNGKKFGVVESFQTLSGRLFCVRAGWYNTDGVFFDPVFVAEGELEEIDSNTWRVGQTYLYKCTSPDDDYIFAWIESWRVFKDETPRASRSNCLDYILDSFQGSFVRMSDFVNT